MACQYMGYTYSCTPQPCTYGSEQKRYEKYYCYDAEGNLVEIKKVYVDTVCGCS